MKKSNRIMTVMLVVALTLVFSTVISMATTISSPTSGEKVSLGSSINITTVTTAFEECIDNKNYCNIVVVCDNKVVCEKNLPYMKIGTTLTTNYTPTQAGHYTIYVLCCYEMDDGLYASENFVGEVVGNTYIPTNKKVSFDVIDENPPAGTKISSLKGAKKSFTVKWKKAAYDGYQIRYSTASSMKSSKTVTVSGANKASKTIKSLKSKKKYYVQVRTYKNLGDGIKSCSEWSKSVSVKTK